MKSAIVDLVNDIGAIGILDAAEQGLNVVAVENGDIDECRLVNPHEGLVQTVNQLLEALTDVVVGVLDDISALTILLPEVVSPDKDVGNANCAGGTVAHIADILNDIVKECSQMVGSLVVVVLQEEQTLSGQTSQVVGVAVRQVCSSGCVVQIECAVVFGFEPFFCSTQVVPLLHLVENLVECEELIVGLVNGTLVKAIVDIGTVLTNVVNGIATFAGGAGALSGVIMALGAIEQKCSGISRFFTSLWTGISTPIKSFVGGVKRRPSKYAHYTVVVTLNEPQSGKAVYSK